MTSQNSLRLMAVHAHPDDESSKGAATLAKYVDEGAEVHVVSCTGGQRGDLLNPHLVGDPAYAPEKMPEVRQREMAEAARILGIHHHWLGFVDSGLPEGDPLPPLPEGCFAAQPLDVPVRALVELIREIRPQVMTTYDENGGYPHPDHIMTHRVSIAAFEAAADPAYAPEAGTPWEVEKIYYVHGFHRQRIQALQRAMAAAGLESPYADFQFEFDDLADRLLTTRVPVGDYLEIRDRALLAHRSQIDPDGSFFAVPNELQREAWPTEDYELRCSRIGVTLPETDLFAGVREDRAEKGR